MCLGVSFDRLADAYRTAAAIRSMPDSLVLDMWVEEKTDGAGVWIPRQLVVDHRDQIRQILEGTPFSGEIGVSL